MLVGIQLRKLLITDDGLVPQHWVLLVEVALLDRVFAVEGARQILGCPLEAVVLLFRVP